MIVVSDTSPVNYLILVGCMDVVHSLYTTVAVPPAVWAELHSSRAPEEVRQWLAVAPRWFAQVPLRGGVDAGLEYLGPGEREAIALAEQIGADRLLVDEAAGRQAAVERRIPVIGTLGVLRNAAALGLLDLPDAIERLRKTNFYAAPEIIRFLLDEDKKRRERT